MISFVGTTTNTVFSMVARDFGTKKLTVESPTVNKRSKFFTGHFSMAETNIICSGGMGTPKLTRR